MSDSRRTIEIEPGDIFGNRRGNYEVLSVDLASGEMKVRYVDSGESARLNIEMQLRIWANMKADERSAIRSAGAEARKYQAGYGTEFSGLVASDFKTNVEGTTWRSRRGLGGKVARLLSVGTPSIFTSWAIYRWPVAFLTHRENYDVAALEEGSRKAKFTIEFDADRAYFGFYIERLNGRMGVDWDWPRLMRQLRDDEDLVGAIRTAEDQHACRFIGRATQGDTGHFHFANGLDLGARSLWNEKDTTAQTVPDRLAELERIPEAEWGEVYILSELPKTTAIESGVGVAEHITQVFRALLPIYDAAVGDP